MVRIRTFLPAVQTGCASCWMGKYPPLLLYPVDDRKPRCSEPGAVIITDPPCSVFASSCLSSRAGGEDTEFSYVLSVLPVIRETVQSDVCTAVPW